MRAQQVYRYPNTTEKRSRKKDRRKEVKRWGGTGLSEGEEGKGRRIGALLIVVVVVVNHSQNKS